MMECALGEIIERLKAVGIEAPQVFAKVRGTRRKRRHEVIDGMFTLAAECLARENADDDLLGRCLFPPVKRLRDVAVRIAEAVVREASNTGVGRSIADEGFRGPCVRRCGVPESRDNP